MNYFEYSYPPQDKEDFYKKPYRYAFPACKMVGNLYFVGDCSVGAHVLKTQKGIVLIDSLYPTSQANLIHSLWSIGVNPEDIRYLIHTHGHYDHFGATERIKTLSGCTTYLGRRDYEMFQTKPELSFVGESRLEHFDTFEPDVLLDGGEVLDFGDVKIKVVATPGHSDGCLSFFFDVQEDGKTYTCGLFGGAGLNTLNDDFVRKNGNLYSRDEFAATLEKLLAMDVDVFLSNHTMQGHMKEKWLKQQKDGKNPFIDPTEWKAFLLGVQRKFNEMLSASEFN